LLGFFLLLAALAWPALQHHVAALTGNPAIAAIEEGRALTETGLLRAFASRRDALGALEHNRARRELGQVHLRRADDPDVDSVVRHDDLAAASDALAAALARAPADHFAWYHLAMAEALRERPETAARALENAYEFGPYHPPIRAARIRLGLALWADLEPPSRTMVLTELAQFRADPRR
jgi:tetratricopeptide (TPR) repeat protein